MINLTEGESNQILLLAPNLLGETLSRQLSTIEPKLEVVLEKEQLTKQPSVVIWSLDSLEAPISIQLELRRLQEYWKPVPILLLLPKKIRLQTTEFLQFDCPGLLQDPDLYTLRSAIRTISDGGRVVRLRDQSKQPLINSQSTMGLGQWLLISGMQQINNDLKELEHLLDSTPNNTFQELLLEGRQRELKASSKLLYWIWAPAFAKVGPLEAGQNKERGKYKDIDGALEEQIHDDFGTNIELSKRDATSVWKEIRSRLERSIEVGVTNSTNSLLAIEALSSSRQKGLLLNLLSQLEEVIEKLRNSEDDINSYKNVWNELKPELLQQALRGMAGSYVRIPFEGKIIPVAEKLVEISNWAEIDEELPDIEHMLDPLLIDTPLVIEGQLLPVDDPRSLIQLELFISNWLIRNAELITSEVIESCGAWPELRRLLLKPELISTRELERLRNQLNSQSRWKYLIQRPIQLYESTRLFYQLSNGKIESSLITEPRDEELKKLGWWQQQVALLVEIRDAMAPQIQALIKRFGDLMVIVLTQVIGRAIGLVGRGIAQGMGRTLSRN